MAIYTPRGLKIRFSIPYSFSLMARVFPDITPFRVLKKTEAIENLSDVLAVLECVIIVFFFPDSSLLKIFEAVMIAYFVGYIMKLTGIFFIPLIIPLSEAFSYVHGYGVIALALGIAGYYKIGLLKTAALLTILLAINIVDCLVELFRAFLYNAMHKPFIGVSELNFINAYKMLAASIGVNINTNVTEQEINSEAWKEPYLWLEINWPEIESKYTVQG